MITKTHTTTKKTHTNDYLSSVNVEVFTVYYPNRGVKDNDLLVL